MLAIIFPELAFTITTHMFWSLHRGTVDGSRRLEDTRSPLLEAKQRPGVMITHAGVDPPLESRSVAGGTAASISTARCGTACPWTIERAREGEIDGSNHRDGGSTEAPNAPGSSCVRVSRKIGRAHV